MATLPDNPELLLRERAWLRSLARQLVRPHEGAEDLAHDTLTAAVMQPAPRAVGLRGWLACILRKRIAGQRRAAHRRRERETIVAPGDVSPPTLDVVSQCELQRDVVDAVLALCEPYRTTVLLRFWEGLRPGAIAARTQVPVETVRTRLKRGLAQLRERLDRTHGGDRRAWVLPLCASLGSTAPGLVLLAPTPAKCLLAGAAALMALLLVPWPQAAQDFVPAAITTAPSLAVAASPRTAVADDPVPIRIVAPEPSHWLRGRVVDDGTKAPVAGARVTMHGITERSCTTRDSAEWTVTSDGDGRFRQDVGDRSIVQVEVSHAEHVPHTVPLVVVADELEIPLLAGTPLVVQVIEDLHGDGSALQPLVGAACRYVVGGESDRLRAMQSGVTDANGEVVFRVRDADLHLVVERPQLPGFALLQRLEQGQQRIRVVLHPLGEVVGTVVDRHTRMPIAGAVLAHGDLLKTTAADGSFCVPDDLADNGGWVVTKPGYGTAWVRVYPQRTNHARIPDIELERDAQVTGVIAGFDGEVQIRLVTKRAQWYDQRWSGATDRHGNGPFAIQHVPASERLWLEIHDEHGHVAAMETNALRSGAHGDFGVVQAFLPGAVHGAIQALEPEGTAFVRVEVFRSKELVQDRTELVTGPNYRIEGLLPGSARVWLEQLPTQRHAGGGVKRGVVSEVEIKRGSDCQVDLDLGGTIRGFVIDAKGVGVPRALVSITPTLVTNIEVRYARTDAHGAFACAGLARNGTHRVEVRDWLGGGTVMPEVVDDVVPGRVPLYFGIQSGWSIAGTVDAGVLGDTFLDLYVQGENATGERASVRVRADGGFTLPVRGPGPYSLRLETIAVSGDEPFPADVPGVGPLAGVMAGGLGVVFRGR